jgi:hypothetical protein
VNDILPGCDCVAGFVDGTLRPIARPKDDQRSFYSGHKKHHGYKYQGVSFPDGLLLSIDGPFEGRANDFRIVGLSGLERRLRAINEGYEKALVLYGDNAYRSLDLIVGPFLGTNDPEEVRFNYQMSTVRISVENAFGLTQTMWSSLALAMSQKSGLMPVACYFEVSVLLTNCLSCVVGGGTGNSIARRFGCPPFTIEEYLGGAGEMA